MPQKKFSINDRNISSSWTSTLRHFSSSFFRIFHSYATRDKMHEYFGRFNACTSSMYWMYAESIQFYTTSSIRDRIETCRSLNARMRGDVVIASCSHFTPPSREERAIPGHNARGSFHSSDMLHPLSHHLSSHDPRPVRVSNEIWSRVKEDPWIMEHVPTRLGG